MTGSPKHSPSTITESRPSKIPKTQDHRDQDLEDKQLQESSMSKSPRIQRYLVAIEYIGTRFSGSQQQPNCRTVVGVLEEAFHKFIGQPVSIFCSSRTDAGVHALSNVCHVDVERISKRKPGEVLPPHEPSVVRRAVNHFLQKNDGDISVIDVRCVPNDFHARYKAEERTYFYRLVSGPEPLTAFEKERVWHVQENLDLYAMQEACKVLVGHHDFSSFRASGCQANSPIRTLDELHVCEVPATPYFPSTTEREQSNSSSSNSHLCSIKPEVELPINSFSNTDDVVDSNNGKSNLEEFGVRRRHRCYVVTARARSFLYHQVRLLVGVLKCAGTGELTTSAVEKILNAKTVTAASPMAPACGLYLGRVKYDLP
ncbi:Pseudouridine synthase family protein isoform 2 [Hibiscus syriacus]|uniref:tRNA pseudouridine synthase n=1 Tax=Hibiscus syriacus TaxID=106335 RepID=A0A6A3A5A0_HIBSY|nr:tRNA pseudouridine synthase A-like isoform X1 [Hibiscus syriacus]KAE8698827.1 Pseudouridine synthase family protein isoform 2 [Hibiscus syriacus]